MTRTGSRPPGRPRPRRAPLRQSGGARSPRWDSKHSLISGSAATARAAIAWLVAAGLAAQDRQLREALRALGGSGAIVPLADDPGPMPPPAAPEDLHQVEAGELPCEPPTAGAPQRHA